LGLVALAACTPASDAGGRAGAEVRDSAGVQIVTSSVPAWSESERWTLGTDPLFVLHGSDGTPENRLLDPSSIDVDSRGRVIVADGLMAGWHAVLVYDSLGRFQFQAGGRGNGPGEFGQLWWASTYRGDSIVAFDMSGDKLSVFDSEGKFARQLRSPRVEGPIPARGTWGYTDGIDAAYGDGHFLAYPGGSLDISAGAGPAWYTHQLVRLAPDGERWDSLGTFEISQQYWDGQKQEQLWFGPWTVRAVDDSSLYFGRGDRFEISRHSPDGRVTRIIRWAATARPMTQEYRDRNRDWYLDMVRSSPEVNDQILERIANDLVTARHAEYLPAYSGLLVDGAGYLWVEEFRWTSNTDPFPVMGPTRWWVFRPDGSWAGSVEAPPGLIIRKVTMDRVFGFMVDDDGVKEVLAYRLDRKGEGP